VAKSSWERLKIGREDWNEVKLVGSDHITHFWFLGSLSFAPATMAFLVCLCDVRRSLLASGHQALFLHSVSLTR